jgi:DNA ligase (NAD+)
MESLTPESKAQRIEELVAKRKEARRAYYVDHNPIVSDEVYDGWEDELRELEADNPDLAVIGDHAPSGWSKVRHEIPMGSLDKVKTPSELTSWVHGLSTGNQPFEELLVTEKLDGISVAIQYDSGAFVRGVTRGDGIEGDDISVNVCKMKGVPGRLSKKFTGEIRGEIIVLLSDMKAHFSTYSNPRNTAGGVSSRLDGQGCEHLTVLAYQVDGLEAEKRSEHIEFLEEMGFNVPGWYVTAMAPGIKTPHDLWLEYQQGKRMSLDYAIDGLVVELNSIPHQLSLGDTNGRPKGARAFKFAPITRQSVVRTIESATGVTGQITPVVIFDEVNLLGTKVSRASLYNWKYVQDLKLDVGCKILVARANDVIPRVVENLTVRGSVAEPPSVCPSCGATTEWDGPFVVCPNTFECPAQALGRLVRYVSSLNILEWGEAVLARLLESGLVSTVADLYKLDQAKLSEIDRMGNKSAKKLLDNLHSKSPVPIDLFFGSLAIPGCGKSVLTLVVDAGFDTYSKLKEVTYDQLLAIKGIGPVRARTLVNWFAKYAAWVDTCGIPVKDRIIGNLTGKSFCFTGKTKNKRAVLEGKVTAAGGTVKDRVGKGLTYLVLADPSSASLKAQAAKKHGTETISEEAFLNMV